ncbi:MAG: MFS transporter [Acidimicrobiia bacterium]|nr:MFS transporter [Acidimicrobiia bacterium]
MATRQGLTVSDRRILTLMALAGLVLAYSGSLISHTFPFVRRGLSLTEGEMSWVFALTRFFALGALLFSVYGDRFGRRRPFLVAFAIAPLGSLLTAFAPGALTFTIFQAITRIGVVAAAALSIVFLAEELSPRLRGFGIGVAAIAGAVGNGISLILLPIADRGDSAWRFLFALAAVGLLALPVLMRFLKESRAFAVPEYHVPLSAVVQEGHGQYLYALGAVAFFVSAFATPALDFALERMIDDLAWTTASARNLLIVFSGLGTLGLLAGGRLADNLGRRPAELVALALGLAGGLGFYFFDSGWLIGPSLFVGTFGATALTPAFAAQRSELFPTRLRATAGAWITNAAIIGSIFGFAVGGVLIDRIGLSSTVAVLGIGIVVAAFLVGPLPETRGRDLTSQVISPRPS